MADMEEDYSWDADDFDPDAGFRKDEWEGEDADLKEVTVEPKKEEEVTMEVVKSKKPKEERIKEKKAKRREADLAQKALQEEQSRPLTAAEQATEKLRLLELQKAADLETAKELFGVSGDSIDTMDPQTPEDFDILKDALAKKLNKYEASPHFVEFMDGLLQTTCAGLDVEDLRKMSKMLSSMATEKQKLKAPKTAKKKVKASLGVGKAAKKADFHQDFENDLGGEFDDFM